MMFGGIFLALALAVDCGSAVYEKTAAEELTNYLPRVAKAAKVRVGATDIACWHVGDTPFARSHGLGTAQLADEEWAICVFGSDVVLNGGGTRGCLYAVYHFLEDDCGVRWWAEDDEDVPPPRDLSFPSLNRRGRPFFGYRQIYLGGNPSPRFAARCRFNDNGDFDIPLEFGAGREFGLPYHAHVWDRYFPFEKYGKEHPEWYAFVDGKRIGGQFVAQMCLSCPGLTDAFVAKCEEYIAQDEANCRARGGYPTPKIYSMSMNDNFNYCHCENCLKEIEKYGHSGQQIKFVNAIAAKIAVRHPDIIFRTSAYNYTMDPPKGGIRPLPNVKISIANMNQNMAQPITHADNRKFREQLAQWSKFGKLMVSDYTVTYIVPTYGFPFPSETVIPQNLRYYADLGVDFMTIEHEMPQTSDMYDLKLYLDRKCLEDPYQDAQRLTEDFYARYFGAAAPHVRAARDHLRTIYDARKAFVSWFPPTGEFNWIHADDISRMTALFDAAERAVAKDKHKVWHVRKARNGLDRLAAYRKSCGTLHAPEFGVSDRPFFDFRPDEKLWSLYRLSDLKFVDDATAASGRSVYYPAGKRGFSLPFPFGLACGKDQKEYSRQIMITKSKGPGWNWYTLPAVKFPPKSCYVYFDWVLQLPVTSPEIAGNTYDVKVHARFEKDALYVDRIAFVPSQP